MVVVVVMTIIDRGCYGFTISMCLRLLRALHGLCPFSYPVAAERLGTLTLVSPSPFLLVTLVDAMRSMDVLALYFPVSRDLGRFRVTSLRFAYSYVSRFRLT